MGEILLDAVSGNFSDPERKKLLPSLVWLCKNGEPCTSKALKIAMGQKDLPMVKFMVRNGALQDNAQPFGHESLVKKWSGQSHDSNLGVLAFMYDTAFGGSVSQSWVEEAVKTAINRLSVRPLRWLQDKGCQFDITSAKQYAVSHFESWLEDPEVERLIHWLDMQASLTIKC